MLEYVKRLITPDMVSFWLPSGQNRAMDIIRGNHGQCYGTHPNVPVLPNLINPSVGWHFDGTDDLVSVLDDNSLDITGDITIGTWVNPDTAQLGGIISKTKGSSSRDFPYLLYFDADSKYKALFGNGTASVNVVSSAGVTLDKWYFIVVTIEGTAMKLYQDASVDDTDTFSGTRQTSTESLLIGKYYATAYFFDGYIALPFVANKAWSIAQVKNFYNATKGMFAPRG